MVCTAFAAVRDALRRVRVDAVSPLQGAAGIRVRDDLEAAIGLDELYAIEERTVEKG